MDRATILDLYYMVSIHTVLRVCLAAPIAMIYCLTPSTSTGYYNRAPCPVLWGGVLYCLDLGWQGYGSGVDGTHQWGEGSQLGHERQAPRYWLEEDMDPRCLASASVLRSRRKAKHRERAA